MGVFCFFSMKNENSSNGIITRESKLKLSSYYYEIVKI